jgi:hypothetical protein
MCLEELHGAAQHSPTEQEGKKKSNEKKKKKK